jgi:predicted aspartyl protease
MWRTAKNMATALEELNKTLPEILANMQEITTNIHSATDMIRHEAEEFVVLSQKVRAFLGMLNDLELTVLQGVRVPLLGTLKTTRGVLKGIGAFLNVFLQQEGKRP